MSTEEELVAAKNDIDQWAAFGPGADEGESAAIVANYEYRLRMLVYDKLSAGLAAMAAAQEVTE
ncbi:MAG: hypothetical protein FWC58_05310 [Desulfobulbus sp.]|nr:hypothetical protein [Desulfobulbus sp.]